MKIAIIALVLVAVGGVALIAGDASAQCEAVQTSPGWLTNASPAPGTPDFNYRSTLLFQVDGSVDFANTHVALYDMAGRNVPISESKDTVSSTITVSTNYGGGVATGLGASATYRVEIGDGAVSHTFYFQTDGCHAVERARLNAREAGGATNDFFATHLNSTDPIVDQQNVTNGTQLRIALAAFLTRDSAVQPAGDATPAGACTDIGVICLGPHVYKSHESFQLPSCMEVIGAGDQTTVRLRSDLNNQQWVPFDPNNPSEPIHPIGMGEMRTPFRPFVFRNICNQNACCSGPTSDKCTPDDSRCIDSARTGNTVGNSHIGLRSLRVMGCTGQNKPCEIWEGHNTSTRGQHGIGFINVTDSFVLDVHVSDTNTDGIAIGNHVAGVSRRITVAQSELDGIGRHGILINAGVDSFIQYNSVHNTGNTPQDTDEDGDIDEADKIVGNGISLESSGEHDLDCDGLAAQDGSPDVDDMMSLAIGSNDVSNNRVYDTGRAGVHVQPKRFCTTPPCASGIANSFGCTQCSDIQIRHNELWNIGDPTAGIEMSATGIDNGIDANFKIARNDVRGAKIDLRTRVNSTGACHYAHGTVIDANRVQDRDISVSQCGFRNTTFSNNIVEATSVGLTSAMVWSQNNHLGTDDPAPGSNLYSGNGVRAHGAAVHEIECDNASPSHPWSFCSQANTEVNGDQDGIVTADNCPDDYNPSQLDADGDGIGDACDMGALGTDLDCRQDPLNDPDGDGTCNPPSWDPSCP